MRLERQIRRVFGLKGAPRPSPEHLTPETEGSLAYLGYPTLQQVDFFLALPSLERWRLQRLLAFPEQCCVCQRGVDRYLPAYEYTGLFGMRGKAPVLERIPHCEQHGSQDEARLIVTVDSWSEAVRHVTLIGLNRAFLLETATLNQAGAVPPPWRAFPTYSPVTMGWRQGNGEYWMMRVWQPFWSGLSPTERSQYLDRWEAPTEWREWYA
jgi:hypothetical protein